MHQLATDRNTGADPYNESTRQHTTWVQLHP